MRAQQSGLFIIVYLNLVHVLPRLDQRPHKEVRAQQNGLFIIVYVYLHFVHVLPRLDQLCDALRVAIGHRQVDQPLAHQPATWFRPGARDIVGWSVILI